MLKYKIVEDRRRQKGQQTASAPDANGSTNGVNGKVRRDSLTNDSSNLKRASVWILNGNTLTRRAIRTGLEDGTQVQVLGGLITPNDEIVDGVQQAGVKTNSNDNQRSPFMPQRRGGQGNNRGTGSGQGGGNRPR
jgi:HlyD family secretion protein